MRRTSFDQIDTQLRVDFPLAWTVAGYFFHSDRPMQSEPNEYKQFDGIEYSGGKLQPFRSEAAPPRPDVGPQNSEFYCFGRVVEVPDKEATLANASFV